MVIINKTLNNLASVSVLIPCYCCKNTIERAVKSVAEQTLRPAELILVDDASNDGTLEFLFEIKRKYGNDWIKIVPQQENGGPGAARNAGWDIATQPFIAFLDADDAWHPQKIEVQLKYMEDHHEVALTAHKCKRIEEKETVKHDLPKNCEIIALSLKRLLFQNIIPTRSVMIRSDLPFRFDPNKNFSEDYLLWLSILFEGYKATLIDLELAYFYKAPYGDRGLSSQLWRMEVGELGNYVAIYKGGLVFFYIFVFLYIFSLLKFLRRCILVYFRRFKEKFVFRS